MKEEYLKFSEAMMDKPRSYYAFEMLYWCGMRSSEFLAFEKQEQQKEVADLEQTISDSKEELSTFFISR